MPTNVAATFQSDIENYIADKTLPLARKQLVAYQFGDPATMPEGRGTTYTATRFNRIALPFAPLSEGVPPVGQSMSITQVSATMLQWGDKVTITDVAELTIKHPLFKQAITLTALQVAETLERNTHVNLLAGTQVNYVNTRGARASLVAGDVLNPHEVNRASGALVTLGAPRFMGDEQTDTKIAADAGGSKASKNPRSMPHFTSIIHPLVAQDMRENNTVVLAWSYSDLNRLYNAELGEWGGIRFCESNMVPSFTGVAAIQGTIGTAGALATGNYYVQVTASDSQNQYESRIYQVSNVLAVVGPQGSVSVALPSLPGYTFNVYIDTDNSPGFLGNTASGPTMGPMAGLAVQLAGNQTVVITGTGTAQVPPAAPATDVTVYPTYVFGRGAYAQVVLKNAQFTYLKTADKSDPLNQLRVIGWKCFYGMLIQNQQFFMRIESTSNFTATFG